jgi:hypothetical protein
MTITDLCPARTDAEQLAAECAPIPPLLPRRDAWDRIIEILLEPDNDGQAA